LRLMKTSPDKIRLHKRLLTRLLGSHILIVVIPLFITGKVLVETAKDSITETILTRNLEFASRSTRFVDLKLTTAGELLRTLAQFLATPGVTQGAQGLTINTLLTEFDAFNEISLIDTTGKILLSTAFDDGNAQRITSPDFISVILDSFKTKNRFRGQAYTSAERLPMLDIAEPLLVFGDVVGILHASVDLKAMWDLVEENIIGKKGEAFIFEDDGSYIAHSNRKMVYSEARFTYTEVLQAIQAGESKSIIYTNAVGVEMAAAYAPIGEYGWGAMLQQPTSEAFEPAIRMQRRVFQFLFLSALLASLLAYFFSRWLVEPVKLLVSGMERFSAGDMSYRVPKVRDDEVGALAESFNNMAERLIAVQNHLKRAEVLETLSKLASVLSHEIRNPLNSMVINMQILKRELHRDSIDKTKVEKFYGILEAEIRRVDKLVGDFLLVARPAKIEKHIIKINKALDEVVMLQVADSLNKGIRIERLYDTGKSVFANVDPEKIRQVFLNIIINAVQAMPGGGKLQISLKEKTLRASPASDSYKRVIVISFSDTGQGISRRDLRKVFDFYFSTKDSGSGLGLAVVQQIIDEHQGEISVKSAVDKGATFTVTLPISEPT